MWLSMPRAGFAPLDSSLQVRPDPTLPEPQLKAEIMLLTEKGLRVEIRKLPSSTFSAPDAEAEADKAEADKAAEDPAPAAEAKPQQQVDADADADVLQSPPVRRRAKKAK